jgi:hypothetical protein
MKGLDRNQNWLQVGRTVLEAEAQAIVGVASENLRARAYYGHLH